MVVGEPKRVLRATGGKTLGRDSPNDNRTVSVLTEVTWQHRILEHEPESP